MRIGTNRGADLPTIGIIAVIHVLVRHEAGDKQSPCFVDDQLIFQRTGGRLGDTIEMLPCA